MIVTKLKKIISEIFIGVFTLLHIYQVAQPNNFDNIAEYHTNYHKDNWEIEYYYGNIPIADINHFEDNKLLLSTFIGLQTFDGEKFTSIKTGIEEHNEKKLFEIYKTTKNIIWSYSNIGLFKTENGSSTNYAINSDSSVYNLLAFDQLENPWIVNSKNLYTIINDKLTRITDDNDITAIASGKGNYVIIATNNKFEKITADGTRLYTFTLPNKKSKIIRIMEDSLKRIWVITIKGIYIHEEGKVTEIKEFSNLKLKTAIHLYSGLNDKVYLKLKRNIFVYESKQIYKLNFRLKKGFRVRGFLEDKYGNLWFGSWGQGLTRLKKTNLSVHDDVISNPVVLFNHTNGDKWMANFSSETIIRKFSNEVIHVEPIKNAAMIEILDIEQSVDNNVLAAFTRGLVKYNNSGEIIYYYDQFEGKVVSRLMRDKDNKLWVLVGFTVYTQNPNNENEFIINNTLKDIKVKSMHEIGDAIIFQTISQTYILKENKLIKASKFDNGTGPRYSLFYDQKNNSIWYGTNKNSLVHIIGGEKFIYKFKKQLSSVLIYDLVVDNQGNIIFVSENGIFIIYKKWFLIYDSYRSNADTRLNYKILLNPIDQKYECNGFDDAITIDEKDRILITCKGGIYVYKHKIDETNLLPVATINQIHYNNNNSDFSLQNIEYEQPLKSINFTYGSAFLNASLPLEYRHKLHGVDNIWEYTSTSQSSAYLSPKPGKYTFEVQVRSTSSDWQSNERSRYDFTVLPYFYQTNWFYALSLALMFITIALFIKYRTQKILREKKKLTSIVDHRTKSLKQLQAKELKRELTQKNILSKQVEIKTKELKSQLNITLAMERQLRDSQKMELIGHLASGIAHDFNNILSVVFLGSEIIEDSLKKNKTTNDISNKWLKNIKHASTNGKDIIEKLLLFAKTKPKLLHSTNLGAYINQSITLIEIAMPESITLEVNLCEIDMIVDIDKTKLNQVLLNLVLNAKEAISEQGSIQISTSMVNSENLKCSTCSCSIDNSFVRIDIIDSGKGLTTNDLKKLFELYYTTKSSSGGSGIGLQIVNTNTHEMNGHIIAKNNKEIGTTFSIFLPKSNANNKTNPKKIPMILEKQQSSNKINILLVEDSVILSKSIKQILQIHGHFVDVAFDGEAGFKVFQDNAGKYDIVITDNSMPKLTGINMAKKILAIKPSADIIIFTGYQENGLEVQAEQIGIRKIIQKPFNSNKLLQLIAEVNKKT